MKPTTTVNGKTLLVKNVSESAPLEGGATVTIGTPTGCAGEPEILVVPIKITADTDMWKPRMVEEGYPTEVTVAGVKPAVGLIESKCETQHASMIPPGGSSEYSYTAEMRQPPKTGDEVLVLFGNTWDRTPRVLFKATFAEAN